MFTCKSDFGDCKRLKEEQVEYEYDFFSMVKVEGKKVRHKYSVFYFMRIFLKAILSHLQLTEFDD